MDEVLQAKLKAIEDFLNDGTSFSRSGAGWQNPVLLPSEGEKDAYDLYAEDLLPRFLEFANDKGFNLLTWDRKKALEPLRQTLSSLVDDFNGYVSPTVHDDTVYFVRCYAKDVAGLPKTQEDRQYFLESKRLFAYRSYQITESQFFRMIADYINLADAHERLRKANEVWTIVALVSVFVAAVSLFT